MNSPELSEAVALLNQATELQAVTAECISKAACLIQRHLTAPNGHPLLTTRAPNGNGRPVIDTDALVVHWGDRSCPLGATVAFRLLARLCRRPGHFVQTHDLLADVWRGDVKAPNTIRSAVRRLKQELVAAGMQNLAAAIRCEDGRYGLVLNGQH